MASSTVKPPATNLATLVSIKRKLIEKNEGSPNAKQLPPPPPIVTGAHSNEKISYRQDAPVANPPGTTAPTVPANSTDQTKGSRKTKQLEVDLLDKKMEEINRKQEEKTNEALGTWKGFDSLNYGFTSTPNTRKSTPPPSEAIKQQRTPTPPPKKQPSPVREPSAKKQPSPKRVDSPVKDQPKPKSPLKQEKSRETTPSPQKTNHKEPSPSPPRSPQKEKPIERRTPSPPPHEEKPIERRTPSSPPHEEKPIDRRRSSPPPPPPRRSKVKSPEQEKRISSPQIFERSSQSLNRSSAPIPNAPPLKLFPDIKHYELRRPRHALKSIQRSMDRYRFHVW